MSLAELMWLVAPPLCWGCGAVVRGGGQICGRCRAGLRWLGPDPAAAMGIPAWAPVAYDGAAGALVRALKYRGAVRLADTMAAAIVAGAPPGWLAPPRPLVPVPLHPARRRRRGFNQAELLARALARRAGLPVCDCLVRDRRGHTQVGSGRARRLAEAGGTVAQRPGVRVPPRPLIVDDVITTGATLAACAAVLREAGSREVIAVAYARTPGR